VGDFDSLLEAWARWLADDRGGLGGTGASMLARWMDAKGHLIFGGGSGSGGPLDDMETRIEAAVHEMGKACQMRADVLRLEYAAGWWQVAARLGLKGYDPRGLTQLHNALHLGVSVRTYRTRLAEARAYVAEKLGRKP
jgi:hypothetical protein